MRAGLWYNFSSTPSLSALSEGNSQNAEFPGLEPQHVSIQSQRNQPRWIPSSGHPRPVVRRLQVSRRVAPVADAKRQDVRSQTTEPHRKRAAQGGPSHQASTPHGPAALHFRHALIPSGGKGHSPTKHHFRGPAPVGSLSHMAFRFPAIPGREEVLNESL